MFILLVALFMGNLLYLYNKNVCLYSLKWLYWINLDSLPLFISANIPVCFVSFFCNF